MSVSGSPPDRAFAAGAAGGTLAYVYDPDPGKVEAFRQRFGAVRVARSFEEIVEDQSVRLVAAAAIPSERCSVGLRAMRAGKDYFTDKSPFTTLEQLESARRVARETGKKYAVYYAERLHNRPTYYAGELIRGGAIGRVLQMIIVAPHNLAAQRRPAWFFEKKRYGGIITDIGSHQFEQFLYFSGAKGGVVNFARVENFDHPEWPGLEDFGEASFRTCTISASRVSITTRFRSEARVIRLCAAPHLNDWAMNRASGPAHASSHIWAWTEKRLYDGAIRSSYPLTRDDITRRSCPPAIGINPGHVVIRNLCVSRDFFTKSS